MAKSGNFNAIISGEMPVLVDFHATWCGPCKVMEPIIKELAIDLRGKLRIIKIDIDKNSKLAGKYGIRSVPTLTFFKDGQKLWQQSGVMSLVQLKKALHPLIPHEVES